MKQKITEVLKEEEMVEGEREGGREGGREGTYLGDINGADANPLGSVDPEGNGKGVETHCPITLDGLKVVDDGDAEPGQTRGGERERGREGGVVGLVKRSIHTQCPLLPLPPSPPPPYL